MAVSPPAAPCTQNVRSPSLAGEVLAASSLDVLDVDVSDRTGAAPIGLVVEVEFRPCVPKVSLEFPLRFSFVIHLAIVQDRVERSSSEPGSTCATEEVCGSVTDVPEVATSGRSCRWWHLPTLRQSFPGAHRE